MKELFVIYYGRIQMKGKRAGGRHQEELDGPLDLILLKNLFNRIKLCKLLGRIN